MLNKTTTMTQTNFEGCFVDGVIGHSDCSMIRLTKFEVWRYTWSRIYEIPTMWLQRGRDAMPTLLDVPALQAQLHRETGRFLVEEMPEWETGEIE
jgi:hypothetical protein